MYRNVVDRTIFQRGKEIEWRKRVGVAGPVRVGNGQRTKFLGVVFNYLAGPFPTPERYEASQAYSKNARQGGFRHGC